MAPDDNGLPQAQRRLRTLKLRMDSLDMQAVKTKASLADAAVRLGRLEARVNVIEERKK